MAELYLVRHGQASFGSDNYDQLSELGYQQCHWLGEYFAERDIQFDRIVTGELARQQQSAASIASALGCQVEHEVHPGFNEFDFKHLLNVYVTHSDDYDSVSYETPKALYHQLRLAMTAWANNELPLEKLQESWQDFRQRVADAMAFAQREDKGKVLVVSSGGAISTALSQVLDFDHNRLIDLNLQAKNSGISHFFFKGEKTFVTSFNYAPHLDVPGRLDAITYT